MIATSQILSLILSGMLPDIGAAVELVPRDIPAAEVMVTQTLHDAAELKKELLAVPAAERTYENTVMAYDRFMQLLGIVGDSFGALLKVLKYVKTDDVENRGKPYDRFNPAAVMLRTDSAFYDAFKEYEQFGMPREQLTTEQKYYFNKVVGFFERQGYNLAPEVFAEVKRLTQEEMRLEYESDSCGVDERCHEGNSQSLINLNSLLCSGNSPHSLLFFTTSRSVSVPCGGMITTSESL